MITLKIFCIKLYIHIAAVLLLSCAHTSSKQTNQTAKPLYIVLLGAPGSGKGTQAAMISKTYHVPSLSAGDLLREITATNTTLGKQIAQLMQKGELVSPDLIKKLLSDRIQKDDCQNGFILDGYPRRLEDTKALNEILKQKKAGELRIINLELQDSAILSRIQKRAFCAQCNLGKIDKTENQLCSSCNGDEIARADDNEETVQKRLKTFHAETEPLIVYYKDQKEFTSIDANKPLQEVFKAIKKHITASNAN